MTKDELIKSLENDIQILLNGKEKLESSSKEYDPSLILRVESSVIALQEVIDNLKELEC